MRNDPKPKKINTLRLVEKTFSNLVGILKYTEQEFLQSESKLSVGENVVSWDPHEQKLKRTGFTADRSFMTRALRRAAQSVHPFSVRGSFRTSRAEFTPAKLEIRRAKISVTHPRMPRDTAL